MIMRGFLSIKLTIYLLLVRKFVSGTLRTVAYEKMENKRFQQVLGIVEAKSAIACCETCQTTDGCELVSYNRQSRMCELSEFDIGDEIYIGTEAGWSIYYDTVNECDAKPCQNSGVCQDGISSYTCTCPAGYAGTNCETSSCPSGWTLFSQSCYFIEPTQLSWSSAQAECGTNGGHLANVKTEAINDFLSELYYQQHTHSFRELWVGAYDSAKTNDFYWTDGTAVNSGFKNWDSSEPNNANEQCMIYRIYNAKWNDMGCWYERWSICEKEL